MLDMAALNHCYFMEITPQFGFLNFYVMGSPEIHLWGIALEKVDIFVGLKMHVVPMLGRFV